MIILDTIVPIETVVAMHDSKFIQPEPEPQPEPEADSYIVNALIWGTNGDATGNMLVDKVGNVNIPINGGESITGVDATYGNYVSLSQRTNNYYQINNPSFGTLVTNNGNQLTFSYIFRNTNNTGFGPVFTIRNTSNLWEIYFAHYNSNQIYYNLGLPWDDEYLTSSGPIADNVWVMITVTYDGSTWKIYENTRNYSILLYILFISTVCTVVIRCSLL